MNRIIAKADVSEIWLYDEIGKDWFGEGVTAKDFIAELNAIKSPKIDLHINSPGGQVFEGAAIYNAIKRHGATVTAYVDGIAASIASVIALAGSKLIMAKNAMFMMHNPSGVTVGTAEDMRKTADILDKVRETMVDAYTEKSGKTSEEIIALLDDETWLDAEEAQAAGFVDEVGAKMDLAACLHFVPTMKTFGFKHIPEALQPKATLPPEKDLERALRDVGCSHKQAKAILAKGYSGDLRDVDRADPAPPAAVPLRDVEATPPARIDRAARLLQEADELMTKGAPA
jgi:ATP-dependent Clp endopeptidase proteolytic subunit ClpP